MLNLKNVIKGILVLGIFVVSFRATAQQQAQYSQYMMNYYLINPAAGGTDDYMHFRSGYRNQWTGFDGAPKNYYVSGYSPIGKLHGKRPRGKKFEPHHVIGGMLTGQKMGVLSHTGAYLSYAYHLPITRTAVLSFGAMAGVNQFAIDRDLARFSDGQFDPVMAGKNESKFDMNIGLWFYTPKFFAGVSTLQVTESKMEFARTATGGVLNRHFYATAGYNVQIDRYWSVVPSLLFKGTAAAYQVDINTKVRFQDLYWGGLSYRRTDALAIMGGIGIPLDKTRPNQRHGNRKMLEIGYCYDLTTSKLNKYSYGSHEIMVGLKLPTAGKRIASPSDYW